MNRAAKRRPLEARHAEKRPEASYRVIETPDFYQWSCSACWSGLEQVRCFVYPLYGFVLSFSLLSAKRSNARFASPGGKLERSK